MEGRELKHNHNIHQYTVIFIRSENQTILFDIYYFLIIRGRNSNKMENKILQPIYVKHIIFYLKLKVLETKITSVLWRI